MDTLTPVYSALPSDNAVVNRRNTEDLKPSGIDNVGTMKVAGCGCVLESGQIVIPCWQHKCLDLEAQLATR